MSDKKNDDFVVGMPENGSANGQNGAAKPFPGFAPARGKRDALSLPTSVSSLDNSRGASVVSYCLASMSMTIVNKYVVSGNNWNMNLLYLAVQVRAPISSRLFISPYQNPSVPDI